MGRIWRLHPPSHCRPFSLPAHLVRRRQIDCSLTHTDGPAAGFSIRPTFSTSQAGFLKMFIKISFITAFTPADTSCTKLDLAMNKVTQASTSERRSCISLMAQYTTQHFLPTLLANGLPGDISSQYNIKDRHSCLAINLSIHLLHPPPLW